jgi:hypothetical protein
MPKLDALLEATLLRTACHQTDTAPINVIKRFECPKPHPVFPEKSLNSTTGEHIIRNNHIWHWMNAGTPGAFYKVTVRSRGMGMKYNMPVPVADAVVFDSVRVQRKATGPNDPPWIDLPIRDEFVLAREFIRDGWIEDGKSSWWPIQLPVDASCMVVLGYELAEGDIPVPLKDKDSQFLDSFMPKKKAKGVFGFFAKDHKDAVVVVGPTKFVVVLEFVTVREDNTYVPPGAIGFARMFPLTWVMSSEAMGRIEIQTTVQRPKKGMSHDDPTMDDVIVPLVTADVNQDHVPIWPDDKHLPWWDAFFEYYETNAYTAFKGRDPTSFDHPLMRPGEISFVDNRHVEKRRIKDCVYRHVVGTPPDALAIGDSVKQPRQGQFDNIHMAPRMLLTFAKDVDDEEANRLISAIEAGGGSARKNASKTGTGFDVTLTDIVMAPFCIHDCLHFHTRWSTGHHVKALRGFSGFSPHMVRGATAVPENQSVFVSFPKQYMLRYRAIAEGVEAGDWQVFCHHGFGYVCDAWPGNAATNQPPGELLLNGIKLAINMAAVGNDEPFSLPDDGDGWSRLYWRLRFGGEDDQVVERLTFDLEKCMR